MENTKEYEPFGEEWKLKMMKIKKKHLINILKDVFIERNKLLKKL